jgi:hypothetical protein
VLSPEDYTSLYDSLGYATPIRVLPGAELTPFATTGHRITTDAIGNARRVLVNGERWFELGILPRPTVPLRYVLDHNGVAFFKS